MASNDLVIETVQLTKVFRDWWHRAKVRAVDDLNLKVYPNEIYGFLGPNGSGKTTTIKMLLNLLHPTRGYCFLLGGSSRNPEISGRIGYLPEESYLYKYLTAEETLDFYGRIFGIPTAVRKARIGTLLEMVGLSAMGRRAVGTFSKGMMRRIGLAQALINDPDLLILDEPTSGMDPIGTRQIKDLLVELKRRGKTILLCSHLLADVEDVCDRIGILYGGRMQVEGSVRELLQHGDETRITTGQLSESMLQKLYDMVQSESQQWDVTLPMDKLESFFIKIVEKAQKAQTTAGAQTGTGVSGFLAEPVPSSARTVLDSLVQARVDPPKPSADTEQTETPEPLPSRPEEDKALLEGLTQSTLTAGSSQVEETDNSPVKKPADSKREVREDLLKKLTETKEAGDGSTDIPDPPTPPQGENHA